MLAAEFNKLSLEKKGEEGQKIVFLLIQELLTISIEL